jgi:hypothetical protein
MNVLLRTTNALLSQIVAIDEPFERTSTGCFTAASVCSAAIALCRNCGGETPIGRRQRL